MAATPDSLFPSGGDLDSSQLQMEPDEVDTLREGEDPGTRWVGGTAQDGRAETDLPGSTLLHFFS